MKKWISSAISHPGALRAALHAKKGQPIPVAKLEKAAHSKNPTMRHRADFALMLRGLHRGK